MEVQHSTKQNKWWWLILAAYILGLEAIGSIGTIPTLPAITTWYATLAKPWFNPPNWLFGPVWAILYALMGASLFVVWMVHDHKRLKTAAYTAFVVQILLNIAWSFLFFGKHWVFVALIDIMVLDIAIVWTMMRFMKIQKLAAWLLAPYLFWVAFATVLNFFVWLLNS